MYLLLSAYSAFFFVNVVKIEYSMVGSIPFLLQALQFLVPYLPG